MKKPTRGSAEPRVGHVIQWIWQFLPAAASRSQRAISLPADLFWQHAPLPSTLADRTAAEPRSPSTFSVDDVPAMSSRTADRCTPLTDGLAGLVYQCRFGGFL